MIRFLADENFDGRVVRGVMRESREADIVRVQDTVIYQAPDPRVLEWASQQGRILLTHDIKTMVNYAHERLAAALPMSALFAVRGVGENLPVGRVIEDLLTILGASEMSEWENHVIFLPF